MRSSGFYFFIVLCLGAHVAEVDGIKADVSFSMLGASNISETYKQFIRDLRTALTIRSRVVSSILVLQPKAVGRARFKLVNLTNYNSESINLVIDVVNVYVIAYEANNNYYSLKDTSDEAYDVLFKGIKHVRLPYKGNYDDLERAMGRISREEIYLGFSEISSSIGNMHYLNIGTWVPRAFIVIIQTVSEAARFKYIEKRVSETVDDNFFPDPAFLSLENNWSGLSRQIQIAQYQDGRFSQTIKFRTIGNNERDVKDVSSPIVKGLHFCCTMKLVMFLRTTLSQC